MQGGMEREVCQQWIKHCVVPVRMTKWVWMSCSTSDPCHVQNHKGTKKKPEGCCCYKDEGCVQRPALGQDPYPPVCFSVKQKHWNSHRALQVNAAWSSKTYCVRNMMWSLPHPVIYKSRESHCWKIRFSFCQVTALRFSQSRTQDARRSLFSRKLKLLTSTRKLTCSHWETV